MEKDNLASSFLSSKIKFFQKNLKQIGIIFTLVILISLLFPGGEALKYSYKINDITREPIIAPYTFPILKTEEDYNKDKMAEKKSVAYTFNRKQEVSDIQLKKIDKFFTFVNDYRSAKWRFMLSKQLYYERKYHSTAEKAKNEFIADSTSLEMISKDFKK
jgi:hypothetical protein